jgi:hypothetical protein
MVMNLAWDQSSYLVRHGSFQQLSTVMSDTVPSWAVNEWKLNA